MGDVMTDRLLAERTETEAKILGLKTIAVEQTRDLSEADMASIEAYSKRLKQIDEQLDLTTRNVTLAQDIRDRIALVNPTADHATAYRSAGDVLWDIYHQGSDPDARARLRNAQTRAAQHMGTTAEATVATAGGFGGLIVSPVTGPVIDLNPKGRPWLSLIGVTTAPNSMSFMRPRIVDPDFKTAAQPQTLQKSELASKKFDVAADPLQLQTVGNYLNLSRQAEDFIPSAFNIVVNQLLARLAYASETALATEVANTTSQVDLAADADAAAVRQAIFDAAALVFDKTGALPEWIAMGPQGWARLGGLTDLAGRPLFPFQAPSNPLGSASPSSFTITGLGLTGVVTPAITDGSYYVGNALGIEAYEYRYPVLDAVEPSLLGRQIAVAASLVFYRPTTSEAGAGGTPPAGGDGVVRIAPGTP